VDPTPLSLGSSATYRPTEQLKWWFQDGRAISTMIDMGKITKTSGVKMGGFDFSKPHAASGRHNICSTCEYNNNQWVWTNYHERLPREDLSPPQCATTKSITGWPFSTKIIFTSAIPENSKTAVAEYLVKRLSSEYQDVKATFNTKATELIVILGGLGAKRKRHMTIADALANISAAVRRARGADVIAKEETWRFTKITVSYPNVQISIFISRDTDKIL
jgi:hypothetical protein